MSLYKLLQDAFNIVCVILVMLQDSLLAHSNSSCDNGWWTLLQSFILKWHVTLATFSVTKYRYFMLIFTQHLVILILKHEFKTILNTNVKQPLRIQDIYYWNSWISCWPCRWNVWITYWTKTVENIQLFRSTDLIRILHCNYLRATEVAVVNQISNMSSTDF